jgi:hypothetical protein
MRSLLVLALVLCAGCSSDFRLDSDAWFAKPQPALPLEKQQDPLPAR